MASGPSKDEQPVEPGPVPGKPKDVAKKITPVKVGKKEKQPVQRKAISRVVRTIELPKVEERPAQPLEERVVNQFSRDHLPLYHPERRLLLPLMIQGESRKKAKKIFR